MREQSSTVQESIEKKHPGTDSLNSSEPVFLVIGKLHRSHGVQGKILMEIITDFPERINPGIQVYVGEAHKPLTVNSRRSYREGLIIGFNGYDNPEVVSELSNSWVYVRADDRPELPEGKYYHHQIIGLLMKTIQGEALGAIVDILATGANDIYVVHPNSGGEILIPAIPSVIREVSLQKGEIIVELIPGLLPN
jgi:16S rRNA processing protein RimM